MSILRFPKWTMWLASVVMLTGANLLRAEDAPATPAAAPQLKTLAVGGVKVGKVLLEANAAEGKTGSIGRVAQSMDGQLIDCFNATRKFKLLARSDLGNLIEEQGVKKSGEVAGSQYLLTMSIDDFQDSTRNSKIDETGTTVDLRTVRVVAVVKIYDANDGKVLDTTTQSVELNDRSMASANIKDDGKTSDRLLSVVVHEVAFRAANRVIDVIYPAKVVTRNGNEVTINRGDGTTVAVGQIWSVRGAETKETDPDTGVEIKVPGPVLGKIKVTQVSPLISMGEVVEEAAIGQIARGALLTPEMSAIKQPVPGIVTSSTGVPSSVPTVSSAPLAVGVKKIGIAPVRVGKTLLADTSWEGKGNVLSRVCTAMDSQLIDRLQSTRKFGVVARSDLESLLKENNLALSGLTTANEGIKVKSLDYLLVITIDHFQDHTDTIKYQTTGEVVIRTVSMTAVGKLYDAQSGEVKETTNIDVKQGVPWDASSVSSQDNKTSDTLMVTVAREMAHRVANRVTDVIYPAKILARTANLITLDRGDGTDIQVGQTYGVYKVGKELKDETGQSLGFEEIPVGTVKINSVLPKVSRADVLQETAANEVGVGCILRLAAPAPAPTPGR